MLQALNILENFDLKAMGYNSASYIHTVYQAMSLAFADRDFYYGDPVLPARGADRGPALEGLREGARGARHRRRRRTTPRSGPATRIRSRAARIRSRTCWSKRAARRAGLRRGALRTLATDPVDRLRSIAARPPSIAADKDGWVVSMTPSGGWMPAVIAGRTGIGMSQRAQIFVTDPAENPFNVVEPGKRPRVTLTPTLAFKDGKPWLAFAVQGGDTQDQNLLQFFLNVVEFGMTPQQAAEAPNINSCQMRDSFGEHEIFPGRILLNDAIPDWVRRDLKARGYKLGIRRAHVGPDQRDPDRPGAEDVLGRVEQPRRGLRHRLVRKGDAPFSAKVTFTFRKR